MMMRTFLAAALASLCLSAPVRAVEVVFDYRYDSGGFFTDDRRAGEHFGEAAADEVLRLHVVLRDEVDLALLSDVDRRAISAEDQRSGLPGDLLRLYDGFVQLAFVHGAYLAGGSARAESDTRTRS